MKNIFLTGEKRVGKSTIIENLLETLNLRLGGYMTGRKASNEILNFTANSLYDKNESYPLARVNRVSLEKKVFINSFKYALPKMLDRDLKRCDLLILDELGFMENDIDPFTSKIYEVLDSHKLVLGVLKAHDCEFLNKIRARDDVFIIEVSKDNRNTIAEKILNSKILGQ